jgi:hypothetical protein
MLKGRTERSWSAEHRRKLMNQTTTLKPMPLWQSLVLFGLPALLAVGCQYVAWPYFVRMGLSQENG